MPRVSTLLLLYQEWQGSANAKAVHHGALTIAREINRSPSFAISWSAA
jgi:hypothetical protein